MRGALRRDISVSMRDVDIVYHIDTPPARFSFQTPSPKPREEIGPFTPLISHHRYHTVGQATQQRPICHVPLWVGPSNANEAFMFNAAVAAKGQKQWFVMSIALPDRKLSMHAAGMWRAKSHLPIRPSRHRQGLLFELRQ
jgi:hypothetical protein